MCFYWDIPPTTKTSTGHFRWACDDHSCIYSMRVCCDCSAHIKTHFQITQMLSDRAHPNPLPLFPFFFSFLSGSLGRQEALEVPDQTGGRHTLKASFFFPPCCQHLLYFICGCSTRSVIAIHQNGQICIVQALQVKLKNKTKKHISQKSNVLGKKNERHFLNQLKNTFRGTKSHL